MLTIELAAMPAITYREHLDLFNKYKVTNIPIGKILMSLAFTLVLSLSASMVLSSARNTKIEPANEQSTYFQSASTSYYKSKQSLDDLRSALQVAGIKTEKVDTLREASATSRVSGFFTTIGDIQKLIDQIKLTKENIQAEKNSLESLEVPGIYNTLDAQILAYNDQSVAFLTEMENSQLALKDLITAATPAFYLPTLSDDEIWQKGDIAEIKAYYEKRKEEATKVSESFSKFETTEELKTYKDLQMSHFLLVINLSDNVISVLNRPVEQDDEQRAILKEEAYQILVGAQRENQDLAEQLATLRIKLTSLNNYSSHLASLTNRERIIESGIADGAVTPPSLIAN